MFLELISQIRNTEFYNIGERHKLFLTFDLSIGYLCTHLKKQELAIMFSDHHNTAAIQRLFNDKLNSSALVLQCCIRHFLAHRLASRKIRLNLDQRKTHLALLLQRQFRHYEARKVIKQKVIEARCFNLVFM